jgi:hypothetical protein
MGFRLAALAFDHELVEGAEIGSALLRGKASRLSYEKSRREFCRIAASYICTLIICWASSRHQLENQSAKPTWLTSRSWRLRALPGAIHGSIGANTFG